MSGTKKPKLKTRRERNSDLVGQLAARVFGKQIEPDAGTDDCYHDICPPSFLKTKRFALVDVLEDGGSTLTHEGTLLGAEAEKLLAKGAMERHVAGLFDAIAKSTKVKGKEDGKLTMEKGVRMRIDPAGSQHVKISLRYTAARV